MQFDVAIIGAGIVGLAHALEARRRGRTVVVIEREACAIGASIRNFGFVTITGQRRGRTWARARRSAQLWRVYAEAADIAIEQNGLVVMARRPEAAAVLDAFMHTEMAQDCTLLSADEARAQFPAAAAQALHAALWSTQDLRVESRSAIPQLTAYAARQGVEFRFGCAARAISAPHIETSEGRFSAPAVIVCPGDDLRALYSEEIAARNVTRCSLQMMKLAYPGFRMPAALMSDLSLVRYRGYADLPEAAALRARLEREKPAHLSNGVHLIAVQGGDGGLIVGDSHHYAQSPAPFASTAIEALILEELYETLGPYPYRVEERWIGTYASGEEDMFMARPEPSVRLVMITSGAGASTAFAIAEETLDDLLGPVSP